MNAMNELQYGQVMDAIFTAYTSRDDVPLYGEDYYDSLESLREHLNEDDYFDFEDRIGTAASAIAFNGFCAGFRQAITLLLGDTDKLLGTGGAKDV